MTVVLVVWVAVSAFATFLLLAAIKYSPARWLDDSEVAHDFRRPGRRAKPSTGDLPRTGGRPQRWTPAVPIDPDYVDSLRRHKDMP